MYAINELRFLSGNYIKRNAAVIKIRPCFLKEDLNMVHKIESKPVILNKYFEIIFKQITYIKNTFMRVHYHTKLNKLYSIFY